MGLRNPSALLCCSLLMLVANSQQSSIFSLQPAINTFEEQDMKLQGDFEADDPVEDQRLEAQKHQIAELAEKFLGFIESEQSSQENGHKQLRELYNNHQQARNDDEQPDEPENRHHKKRAPLLPWLPAKRDSMMKRSSQKNQSKRVSLDLQDLYGTNRQANEKNLDSANSYQGDNKAAETKQEKRGSSKTANLPWFKFGLDKKSLKDDIYEYLDSCRKLKLHDLEKIQMAMEQLNYRQNVAN